MRPKPITERRHHGRLIALVVGDRLDRADPALNQVLMKELHSRSQVVTGPSAVRARASAVRKVSAKSLHHARVDVGQDGTTTLYKTAEMSRGTQVANDGRRGVPL